jgi:hypothetical protein
MPHPSHLRPPSQQKETQCRPGWQRPASLSSSGWPTRRRRPMAATRTAGTGAWEWRSRCMWTTRRRKRRPMGEQESSTSRRRHLEEGKEEEEMLACAGVPPCRALEMPCRPGRPCL